MSSLLGGKKKQTSTSTTTVNLPDWIESPIKDIITRGTALSKEEYNPYTGQRVAGFSPDELNAMQMIRNLVGQAPANVDESRGITREVANRGLNGFSQDQLQAYMNPYIQNVLDVGRNRQFQNYDKLKAEAMARLGQTASFGGSRAGLAEAQMSKDFQQQLQDYDTQGLYNAYNEGIGRAFQGTQLAGQASMDLANLANMSQSTGLQGIQALMGVGGQQRAQEQLGLDVNYQDFLTKQAFPYEQLQFASGLTYPVGQLTAGQTTNTVSQQKGGGSGLLGAALGIGSMLMGVPGVGAAVGGGLGSMMSSIAGSMGMTGVQTALNSAGRANPGFIGPYQTPNMWGRYKEGGLVQAYQDGGQVGLGSKISKFMEYMNKWNEGDTGEALSMLPQLKETPSIPRTQAELERIIAYHDMLDAQGDMTAPGGPSRSELEKLWQGVRSGQIAPPSPDESGDMYKPNTVPSVNKGIAFPKSSGLNTSLEKHWDNLETNLGLPQGLLRATRQVESSGGKFLESPAGALGPFQLMPKTAESLGVKDPFNEYEAAVGAANYWAELLDRFDGDFNKAAAAYNRGPTFVSKHGMRKLPKETRDYIKKINKEIQVQPNQTGFREGGIVKGYQQGGSVLGSSKDKTRFQKLINSGIVNPFLTGVENAGIANLKAVSGLENIKDFFTESESDFMSGKTNNTNKLIERMQLLNAGDRLDRGQLPVNLQHMMNQVNPLAKYTNKGIIENARLGPDNNLFVDYLGEGGRKKNPETKKAVQSIVDAMHGKKKQDTLNIPKQEKEKEGFNKPLLAFGAALLGSENGFFQALGEAGNAYVTTSEKEKAAEAQALNDQIDRMIALKRLEYYGKQVDASVDKQNNPFTKEKEALTLQLMRKRLSDNPDKELFNVWKVLMETGQADSPQEAWDMASQYVDSGSDLYVDDSSPMLDSNIIDYLEYMQQQ